MHATLIYDGECPLCLLAVDWIDARARRGTLEYIACQSAERAERFPEVTEAQCMEAIQLVSPTGSVYAGHEALPYIIANLRGWQWVARVLGLPGMKWIAPAAYRFIARNRYMFSILVARRHAPSGNVTD